MSIETSKFESLPWVCGVLFLMAFLTFFVGGMMFWGRMDGMPTWAVPFSTTYNLWERIFVMTAVILTVPGMILLEQIFQGAGDLYLGRLGTYGYIFAAVFILTAETYGLGVNQTLTPLVVLYVVLAFLSQIVIGMALIGTGIVPTWVGWFAILWNIGWLIILPIFSPRDIYFPVVHHVIPLCLGLFFLNGYPR